MRVPRSLSSVRINFLCLLLIYTLAVSLFAPFAIKRIEAAPAGERRDFSASKSASTPIKAPAPIAARAQEQTSRWRDGELLVRFRENSPAQKLNSLLRTNGAQWNGQLRGGSGVERLRLKAGLDPEAVAAVMRSSELVDFAEPNYLITADQTTETTPNDLRVSEQWALKNTSTSRAWGITTGSKQTVIAVIDSGIDFTHPDLINNQWNNSLEQANNLDEDGNGFNDDLHGWDFLSNSAASLDGQGHGTAIAGIIAAQGNNEIGVTGVMWRASLMSLRVLDNTGTGDIASAIEAIDYATANGAQVINCSWGTNESSLALREAINRAAQRGVVVVASAGNNSRDIETTLRYPASFDLPNLISVASTDNNDLLTPFSNWGMLHVSIASPGTDILTTKMGGEYQTVSGTSASAALITGVVGLIKEQRPWLGADRTREMILRGARQVPSLSDKIASKGVVSAAGVLETLNTLPPNEGLDEIEGMNGGEHGSGRSEGEDNPGNSANDRPGVRNRNNPDRHRDGREFSVPALQPTRGVPATGLPNLDELRRKQPTNPKAAEPIPSTRCPHHDPQCTKGQEKGRGNSIVAIQSPIDLLAWGLNLPATEPFPDNITGSSPISDSPFKLGLIPRPLLAALRPEPQPGGSSATFVKADNTTQGTWKGTYGSQGYHIIGDTTSYPSYAQVTNSGSGLHTWASSTNDVRALQKVASTTDRIAACWYSFYANGITEINITDGQTHQLAVYALDWDGNNARSETIDILDAATNTVLSSQPVSAFSNGRYLVWNISGHVKVRVTDSGAVGTAVISGLFFDPLPAPVNHALAANGAVATASSAYSGFAPSGAINGDRKGLGAWQNGYWSTAGPGYSAWLQVDFSSSKTIAEIDVFTVQSDYNNPVEPTEAMTFTGYGIVDFQVQYWDGTAWVTVPGGSVTGNNKVWRKFTFTPITTSKIRVHVTGAADGYSRITELEAWDVSAAPGQSAQSVIWTNVVGASAFGNNLAKTITSGWGYGSGAVSSQTISSGDGYVEFASNPATDDVLCGLSYGDSNQFYYDIDFAIYASAVNGGVVYVFEGGTNKGGFGTFTAGDRFRVAVEGGVVKYYKVVGATLTLLYTSTVTPTYPLQADTAIYNNGGQISNAVISGGSVISSSFSTERIDPYNRTGGGGVDLLSGNANWSLPLLGLKGRAGLDLGLSLSYNSLVWTKSQDGTSIRFDADRGTPSPGFRLGFPVIQPVYHNAQTGKDAYLLISPSGSRTELRQTATPNVYESGDSSYLQLTDNGGTLTLKPTDGSQLTFSLKSGQYHCTQIKDRNGNFITINYDSINNISDTGYVTSIVDTLGRTINFNYDGNLNLVSITQNRGGVTHTWATFGWGNQTINTGFSGMTVFGPQNNTSIPMLTSVSMSDGTYYKFRYNSYAQVDKVTSYAADSLVNGQMTDTHPLNYTSYTHTMPTGANDCPRVTESKSKAEYWNSDQEATTTYLLATDHSAGQMTMPDGKTVYKEMFATSADWKRGLTIGTESWFDGSKKKSTTTAYTQDDTNLPYLMNPRVIETNVSDPQLNLKRTTIDYGQPAYVQYGLPYLVREYAANGTTILRETYTDYNLSSVYLNKRIIGLVSAVHVSDGAWQSKTGYEYDLGGDQLVATPTNAIQHDASVSAERGNLMLVSRYDVSGSNISDESKKLVTRIGYDTNGSVIFTRDHLGKQTNISYEDSFSDSTKNSLNTFAYPTKVTPPIPSPLPPGQTAASFPSTSKYDYHMGVVTYTLGPVPAGQTQGAEQSFEYDSAGRITRINNQINHVNNGAYKRWVYAPEGHVSTYSLVQTGGQEAFSTTVFDGAGRVRVSSADNPNSLGLYKGQSFKYDVMGRAVETSNPAEINSSWVPAGEDVGGWVYTKQDYDWKGRPTLTTLPSTDGGLTSPTRELTYSGCGCAGGEVVTIRDEVSRQQKVTSDVLGRTVKTEVLEGQTVYSTTTNTYNGRDQVLTVLQQAAGSGTGQTTTLTYDGYGRLKTKRAPSQTADTVYAYNEDDTVLSVTDGRGAVSTFSYDDRQQTTGIAYSAPTGMVDPPNVTFSYDAAGNRTSMTDGTGGVSYVYDQLSRLTSEVRHYTGLSGTYELSYTYNLAGGLTSITDPDEKVINYAHDKTGRVTDVTGTTFAGVTQYATNIRHRAWGALRTVSYGNGRALTVLHDSRLQVSSFDIPGVITKEYQYNADGRLRYSKDIRDARFDRSYVYDHMGRVTQSLSGIEARDGQSVDGLDRPYNETFQYDPMNHLTGRVTRNWGGYHSQSNQYVNDRNTHLLWSYDEDGRVLGDPDTAYVYDAAGNVATFEAYGETKTDQRFDGDGRRVRTEAWKFNESTLAWQSEKVTYYLRSSVLGGAVVTELDNDGEKRRTFVHAGGQVLAWQVKAANGMNDGVEWEHRDASGASFRATNSAGNVIGEAFVGSSIEAEPAELDHLGVNAGHYPPLTVNPPPDETGVTYPSFGSLSETLGGCRIDGMPISCSDLQDRQEAGSTATEYMIHDKQGWRPERYLINPVGLGLYQMETPVILRDIEGSYPDTEEVFFRHSQQDSSFGLGEPPPNGMGCDLKLAKIFGGKGAVVSTGYDPPTLGYPYGGRQRGDGHSAAPYNPFPGYKGDKGGIIHVYTNKHGSDVINGLYAPTGGVLAGGGEYEEKGTSLNPKYSNEFRFSYNSGPLKGLTIKFVHVGGTHGGNDNGAVLGKFPGDKNGYGFRIGNIGGIGGNSSPNYRHSHLQFSMKGKIVDPRSIFCKEYGF